MTPFTAESGWTKELHNSFVRLYGQAEECRQCNGAGWPTVDSFDRPCPGCDGSGFVPVRPIPATPGEDRP